MSVVVVVAVGGGDVRVNRGTRLGETTDASEHYPGVIPGFFCTSTRIGDGLSSAVSSCVTVCVCVCVCVRPVCVCVRLRSFRMRGVSEATMRSSLMMRQTFRIHFNAAVAAVAPATPVPTPTALSMLDVAIEDSIQP